jgi:hypothetical protein
MASIGPIITVMISGLWSQHMVRRQRIKARRAAAVADEHEVNSIL